MAQVKFRNRLKSICEPADCRRRRKLQTNDVKINLATTFRCLAAAMILALVAEISAEDFGIQAREYPVQAFNRDLSGTVLPPGDFLVATLIEICSPSGIVHGKIWKNQTGRLVYSVSVRGSETVEESPLGITVNGQDLGKHATIGQAFTTQVYEVYTMRGKHTLATNRCSQFLIPIKTASGISSRRFANTLTAAR